MSQHLLWIGSDPFLTLLLSDRFGSNMIEGAGAKLGGVCKESSEPTALRMREFSTKGDDPLSHLRARSMALMAETICVWNTKRAIQETRMNPLVLTEKPIVLFSFKCWTRDRRQEISVGGRQWCAKIKLCCLSETGSHQVMLKGLIWSAGMEPEVYLLWDSERLKSTKQCRGAPCREVSDSPQS